jgi:hypothetical protein
MYLFEFIDAYGLFLFYQTHFLLRVPVDIRNFHQIPKDVWSYPRGRRRVPGLRMG